MKNDNTSANRLRGSSSTFQDPEQEFREWLNWLKSIGGRDEKVSEIQRAKPEGMKERIPPS